MLDSAAAAHRVLLCCCCCILGILHTGRSDYDSFTECVLWDVRNGTDKTTRDGTVYLSLLLRGLARCLLLRARSDGEAPLIARRVRGIRAEVALHIARTFERGGKVVEEIVALDLELAAGCGHSWRSDAAKGTGESLEVLA